MPRLGKFIRYRFPVNTQAILELELSLFRVKTHLFSQVIWNLENRRKMTFHGSCKRRLTICGLLLLGRLYVS